MRLATFNLLHGRSLSDGAVEPDRLAEAVRSLDADVLGLQEVDRGQPRSGRLDLTEFIAGALGATDWRFAPALLGTPGGTWRPARGEPSEDDGGPAYGVGLVSRLPILRWRVIRLPAAPMRSPILMPGSSRPILLADEPRVALVVTLEGPLTIVTTHLSFVPGWNAMQLRRVVRELASTPGPVVLLGDLNLPGRVPAVLTGWQRLAATPTYPTGRPRFQLDHVLGRGALPAVTALSARSLAVSDHRALVVDLGP